MNKYRTHTCSELTIDSSGKDVVLSGWINKKRDHGNLLFIDLRDNYGMTQCIIDKSNQNFNSLNDENIKSIKPYQNIVLEDLNLNINEKLIYSLFNIIDQDNKFLIVTSMKPISEINFELEDLRSRTKNCLFANIQNPDDELMFALILKNLSDRQITLDKKLINFIIKRIERSYGKIFEFIYKIDKISLKKKKSIDFKIINEALEE